MRAAPATPSEVQIDAAEGRLRLWMVGAILLVGFLARALTFASPLLDFHSWRQADTAAISRNFLRDGYSILHPRVDHIGPGGSSLAVTGLELHAWLTAVVSSPGGELEPAIGRLLSAVYFVGSAALLWSLCRRRYGRVAAFAGLMLYSFGLPLMLYFERAFMNESLLVLLSFLALHEAQRYVHEGRRRALPLLVASCCLVAAIKPTFLLIGPAIAGIFWERWRWRSFLRAELYLLAAATLGAGWAWYTWITTSAGPGGVNFGLSDKLVDWAVLLSPSYPYSIGRRLLKDILGPLGVAACVVGLVSAARQQRRMEIFGLAAFGLYLCVVVVGNAVHNYYQLAVVPVAAPVMALGLGQALRWRPDLQPAEERVWTRLVLVAVLAMATSLVRFTGAHSWFEVEWTKEQVCRELPRRLTGQDMPVFVGYNSPDLLFCLDKRGWLLPPPDGSLDRVTALRARGATIAVVDTTPWGAPTPSAFASFPVLLANQRFVAVRLADSASPAH
jgi:Dolichyl-phosphate-mannose-protein mannosyltransferase